MSRGIKVCPFCGRNIRESDKFCPFCGKKSMNRQYNPVPRQNISQEPKVIIQPTPQPVSTQEISKPKEEKIPETIFNQLELRAQIEIINSNLENIRDKIEKLALKLTSDDTEGIEEQVKKLGDRINDLKAEKRELESDLIDLPFEEIKNKKKDWEHRIAKLQNAFSLGEVSENAYNKLRDEYKQELKQLDTKSEQQKVKINIWIRNMRLERDQIVERLELMKGRHISGEFSDPEYLENKDNLKNKINKLETNIKILRNYI